MRPRPSALALGCVAVALAAAGCTDDEEALEPGDPSFVRDPALDVENRSVAGERRSHNLGQNCLTCHQALGPGRGRFTVGLSVRNPDGTWARDPVLELYTAPPARGGTLVARLDGDALGNVFTTDPLPWPDRTLVPVVVSRDGALAAAMPFPTLSGACNLCHKPGFQVTLEPRAAR
jgi:hypothetical protein